MRDEKLTPSQKSYLTVLYLYECTVGKGDKAMQVTNKFFAASLSMKWQSSNTKALRELCDKGFLKCIIGGNRIKFYSLTTEGRFWCAENAIRAMAYRWEFDQPELFKGE